MGPEDLLAARGNSKSMFRAGAGVGIGMLRMGNPLIENENEIKMFKFLYLEMQFRWLENNLQLVEFLWLNLPDVHFMFSWRCWTLITKFLFHAFWKMLIPYSLPNCHFVFLDRYLSHITQFPFHFFNRYWYHIHDSCETDRQDVRSPSFPKCSKHRILRFHISNKNISRMGLWFFLNHFELLRSWK